MRSVRKRLQMTSFLRNHESCVYKYQYKLVHRCFKLLDYVYKYKIHKPVPFQFRLISGVLIYTLSKMSGKRIENVADIRGYIKGRCKLGRGFKIFMMRYDCAVYGEKRMSFSTSYMFSHWYAGSGVVLDCIDS